MMCLQMLYIFLCVLYQINNVSTKNPSVIIIGAGPAGIAAGTKLLENSITDIKILEAENRIGGRIHSVRFGNGYVDLGAEYCGGQKENIVYELVKDFDLLQPSPPSEFYKVYSSDASEVDSELKEDLIITINSYTEDINKTGNISLGDAVVDKYNRTVMKKYANNEKKLKLANDAIKLIQNVITINEGVFNWQQLPAGGHFVQCEGDQGMAWKSRGYHIILDVLMKSYPDSNGKLPIDDKILLNKKVEKIAWNDDRVEITCVDNSSLKGDHVIFTPSVGVLKTKKDVLFEPKLPREKVNALEAVGFNGIMKIILRFPQRWWKDDDSVFFFLWKKEDLGNIRNEFSDGPSGDGISWLASVPTLSKVAHNPNVFVAWVTGPLVPEMEKTPEDVLLRGCNYMIKRFLGKKYNITDADKVIRSQWNINPNFLGTYSHEKLEHFRSEVFPQKTLAQPLFNSQGHPRVLFAGEATHPTQYATVHGAIKTGIREAERIIQMHTPLEEFR